MLSPRDASLLVEVLVHPRDGRNAQAATNELREMMRSAVGGAALHGGVVAKTGIETMVLALGSAGVISAVVEVLRMWLSRDRPRQVRLSWTRDGERQVLELATDDLSDEGTWRVLLAALGQQVTDE